MKPDVIIVFGSGLEKMGREIRPDRSSESRLLAALEVYRQYGGAMPIITTGGTIYRGEAPTSDYYQGYLRSFGVPDEENFGVPTSKTTIQDLSHARRLLGDLGVSNPICISSEWHLSAQTLTEQNAYSFEGAERVLEEGNPGVVDMLRSDPAIQGLLKYQRRIAPFMGSPVGMFIYQAVSLATLRIRAGHIPDSTGPSLREIAKI